MENRIARDAASVEISFTIIESSSGPLTKTYTVGPDGAPVKAKDAGMSAGTAKRMTLCGTPTDVAEQFADMLSALKQHEALIMAPPPSGKAPWPVLRKDEIGDRTDAIARTKEHFQRPAGPGLFALDIDGKGFPPHILAKLTAQPGKLSGALAGVCPPLGTAAMVIRSSVSVGIRNKATDQQTPGTSGQHRYFLVRDGADAAAFADRLRDHLMLAGFGWAEVSKSGAVLFRTLIDDSASADASRLLYEADAVLADDALEHVADARKPTVREGGLLDTRALPDLTDEQRAELASIKDKLRAGKRGECETVRASWLAERGSELVSRGVKPEVATRVLIRACETCELEPDFLLQLDDGSAVTIREIMGQPAKYHGKTCADPLEPDYGGGRNKAIIYTDGIPQIRSLAHGGITYPLRPNAEAFFTAGSPDDWQEPVDLFADGEPGALMNVPAGALPECVERYHRDVAERMGVPAVFIAAGAIAVASAAIGGTLRIQPQGRDTSWTEAPFLWVVLVENPGGKKSPAIKAVTAPLARVDSGWAASDIPRRTQWDIESKKRKKDALPQGPRPRVRRAVVSGFTVEAFRDVLVENPRGCMVVVDELLGFVDGANQYKGGGSDRTDLLKLADGNPYVVDRVARSYHIPCWGAAVLGGIQPKKLAKIAHTLDNDGLLQRFVPILGDDAPRENADREPDPGAVAAYEGAITGLAHVESYTTGLFDEPVVVTLSPEALAIRRRFDQRINALLDLPQMGEAWRGHVSKWRGFFPRLLLVFHMLDHWQQSGPAAAQQPVSGETAERAWRFANFLLEHAMRFYGTVVGAGAGAEAARKAAGIVLVLGKTTVTHRDIYEKNRSEWRPGSGTAPGDLFDAMRLLGRMGWCAVAERDNSGPTSWHINPQVFERFKDRAASEAERRRREAARVQAAVAERRELKAVSGAAPVAPCARGAFQ